MHIVFAVDKNYAPYIAPQLYRINLTGTKIDGIKVIISEDVTDSIQDSILLAGENYRINIEIIKTSVLDFLYEQDMVNDRTHVSYFTYVKLFLPELLPQLDQILYLDVDILIRSSLNDLLEWELINPIGAISELSANGRFLFGSHNVSYFNAGVMRMSLAKCREFALTPKALNLIQEAKNYNFQDQDIFNLVFRKNFDHLPIVFNVFHDYTYPGIGMDVFRDPIIVHFNGPNKPWNRNLKSKYAAEWRKTFQISGLSAYKAEIARIQAHSKMINDNSGELNSSAAILSLNSNLLNFKSSKIKRLLGVFKQRIHSLQSDYANNISDNISMIPYKMAESLSNWIYSARKSKVGKWLRSRLPYELKKSFNDILYGSYKNFHGIKEVLDSGLFAKPAEFTLSNLTEQIQETLLTAPLEKSQNFIFVISQPRSGTSALFDVINKSSSRFLRANEIFSGHADDLLSETIMKEFPWFLDLRKSEKNPDSSFKRFFDKMDRQVLEILDYIEAKYKSVNQQFVVKIFPTHLSSDRFVQVLENYSSHVIFLRRRMLYSYVSNYKAVSSGHWWGKDSSKTKVALDEGTLRKYVKDSDAWFNFAQDITGKLGLPTLNISYDGLFETKEHQALLGDFLKGIVGNVNDIETLHIPSRIQDRREEAFLNELLVQFSELPADLKRDLLRYPGKNIWTASSIT